MRAPSENSTDSHFIDLGRRAIGIYFVPIYPGPAWSRMTQSTLRLKSIRHKVSTIACQAAITLDFECFLNRCSG